MRQSLWQMGALLVAGALLTGCARGPMSEAEAAPQERVTVGAQEYRFDPVSIRVKKGTRVTIRLENRGTESHEFEIEELDVEIGPIRPGTSAEVTFVADKPGTYSYECHVDGHLQRGMKGTLVVAE